MNPPTLEAREVWNYTVQRKIQLVPLESDRELLRKLNHDTLQQFVSQLGLAKPASQSRRVFEALQPVLQSLDAFTKAISSMVQGDPTGIASLVWGALQVLLQCARSASGVLSRITAMLTNVARTFPRFEEYLVLYPQSPTLQLALHDIYDDFIDFCLMTYKYYRTKPWWKLTNMLWGNVQLQFDNTMQRLKIHRRNFEAETQLLNARVGVRIQAALPSISMTPQVRFPVLELPISTPGNFSGRESILKRLHGNLRCTKQPQFTACVVHGVGGVGKTHLALKYAYTYQSEYDCVFWLRTEKDFDVAKAFAEIAKRMSLSSDLEDQSRNIQLAYDWLKRTDHRWLLIFDNYESSVSLEQYWPASLMGSILITTQDRTMGKNVNVTSELHLEPLSKEEGAKLILTSLKLQPSEAEIATKISELVSGLPLALAQIVGYVDGNCTLKEFYDEFLQRNDTFELWGTAVENALPTFARSLLTVFDISLRALSPDARHLIDVLSMLHPDAIPEEMLKVDTEKLAGIGIARFIETKRNLRSRHLVESHVVQSNAASVITPLDPKTNGSLAEITIEEGILSMHRSLQSNLLYTLSKDATKQNAAFAQAVTVLSRVFPRQSIVMNPVNEKWAVYEKLMPHAWSLHSIFENSNPKIPGNMQLATILCDAGNYLWERGLIQDGLAVLHNADRICETFSEAECGRLHADVLTWTACLQVGVGISQRRVGRNNFERVKELRIRHFDAIPIGKATFVDSMLYANGFNDQGCAFLENEEYDKAEPLLDRALSIKQGIGNDKTMPIEFAETLKNLSFVYMAQGHTKKSLDTLHHASTIAEKASGVYCALTQFYRFQFACMLFNAGQHDQALEKSLDILKTRSDLFGELGVHTLHSYYALGMMYLEKGELTESERLLRCSLAGQSRWAIECTARAKFQLSRVLARSAKPNEAVTYEQESTDILKTLLADHAPQLLQSWMDGRVTDVSNLYDHIVTFHAGRYAIGNLRHILERPSE